MTIKIKASQFRTLEPAQLMITNIYPAYRYGWVESERKFKSYVAFPDTCTRDVVYSGDEDTMVKEGETRFHFRLQECDSTVNKFKFTKSAPANAEFFKNFKKVYDIEVAVSTPVTVKVWSKEASAEVDYTIKSGEVIRITAFPASKIQSIAESMMLTKGIEKVEVQVKDRTTGVVKTEKRLPFNWEDAIIRQLDHKAFEFAVNGSGLDTKYSYREVPAFKERDETSDGGISIEDIPFRQNLAMF